jgi:cell division protein FtsB
MHNMNYVNPNVANTFNDNQTFTTTTNKNAVLTIQSISSSYEADVLFMQGANCQWALSTNAGTNKFSITRETNQPTPSPIDYPINIDHSTGIVYTNSIYPNTDNTYSLGLTGTRWSAIWANGGAITPSDGDLKNSIIPSPLGLNFINMLKPVSFKYNIGGYTPQNDGSAPVPHEGKRIHYGFVAQDVKAAVDASGVEDFGGWILDGKEQALRHDEFLAPMVKAIQELSAQNTALTSQVATLTSQVATLTSQIATLAAPEATTAAQIATMAAQLQALTVQVNAIGSDQG